jgi:carbonic anhydrase
VRKLTQGIVEYRARVRPAMRETFAQLASGQSPDCLFIGCADSRVVPSLVASTQPGDLFVLRNVGNCVPPAEQGKSLLVDASVGAAIEFAVQALRVRDIVVCGHSDCGAMAALTSGRLPPASPHLEAWLSSARGSVLRLEQEEHLAPSLSPQNRLSQAHVLQQIDHLRGYPGVGEALAEGRLALHGWWFDLEHAEVLSYRRATGQFLPIESVDDGLVSL